MKFIIKAKGITIEAETEEDLHSAVRVLHALDERPEKSKIIEKSSTLFSPKKPLIPKEPPKNLAGASLEEKLGYLYEYIKGEPRGNMLKLIRALASASGVFTTKKLDEEFGIDKGGVGGTLGSISKCADKFALKREEVLIRQHSKQGSHFQLTPAMREVVRLETERG